MNAAPKLHHRAKMARTPLPPNEKRVFINVPFDDEYAPLFQALLFTIEGCGFSPCCALEEPGNANPRLLKIFNLIEEAALSIHDLSRTKLDKKTACQGLTCPLNSAFVWAIVIFMLKEQR